MRKVWSEELQTVVAQADTRDYRSRWACFACRTAFVRWRTAADEARMAICPTCKVPARDMGYLFTPPPRRDQRAWARMRVLADHGIRFHRTGSVAFINAFLLTDGVGSARALDQAVVRWKKCWRSEGTL